MKQKTGVLLVNLGTPDCPDRASVSRYLKQFLTDRRVVDYPWLARQLLVRGIIAPLRAGKSAKAYQELWTETGSPLKYYGNLVCQGVQQQLGDEYRVALAMRYQNPSISVAISDLLKDCQRLIVFPLFPQYASATVGSVFEEVFSVLSKREVIPPLHLVETYPDAEEMIEVFAKNASQSNLTSFDHFLFSFHGLPIRQLLKADDRGHCANNGVCCQVWNENNHFCYSAQCHRSAQQLASRLNIEPAKYTVCFQSRLGPEKWTEPYTAEVLKKRAEAGDKRILVFSPAFVSDCLETIIEIGEEYQEEWKSMGGERLDYVESLNDDPAWINLIAQKIASIRF